MNNFYCITFMRQYDDDNTEHKFFCYAFTEDEAIQRFLSATDLKKCCVLSVHVLQSEYERRTEWET